jgi:peroxiredoxin
MQPTLRSVAAATVALASILSVPDRAVADEEGLAKAPSFHAKDMNGEAVALEDLLGKGPVLVDFWATWCKPCIKELPHIQRLHEQYSAKGLTVLAVTIDSPKSQSRVKPFVTGRGFTFTVVMDGSQDVFRKMQGKGSIPYVVVLDADGNIRYRHTGYRPGDEQELEKIVRELLGEPAEAPAAEEAPEESTG